MLLPLIGTHFVSIRLNNACNSLTKAFFVNGKPFMLCCCKVVIFLVQSEFVMPPVVSQNCFHLPSELSKLSSNQANVILSGNIRSILSFYIWPAERGQITLDPDLGGALTSYKKVT